MSRKDGEDEKEGDNQNVIILPEEWFRRIVEDRKEQLGILERYHDSPMAGHPGVKWMLKSLQRDFQWLEMEQEVKEYIKGCMECQRNKADQRKKHAPLNPLSITYHPWERISVNHYWNQMEPT